MKPLGLESKLDAPAIVRTNPLRELFTSYADGIAQRAVDATEKLNDALARLECRWADVLDVISYAYPARRSGLGVFLFYASARCTDRTLVYDLDTPDCTLCICRHPMLHHQTVVMSGSCEYVSVSGCRSTLIVTGEAEVIRAHDGIVVVDDAAFMELDLGQSSFGVCASRKTADGAHVLLGESSLLLSSTALRYRKFFHSNSAICDPTENDGFRRLYDDVLAAAREPASFHRRTRAFRNRTTNIRADMRRSMTERQDPAVRSGEPRPHYCHFTPRGASR